MTDEPRIVSEWVRRLELGLGISVDDREALEAALEIPSLLIQGWTRKQLQIAAVAYVKGLDRAAKEARTAAEEDDLDAFLQSDSIKDAERAAYLIWIWSVWPLETELDPSVGGALGYATAEMPRAIWTAIRKGWELSQH